MGLSELLVVPLFGVLSLVIYVIYDTAGWQFKHRPVLPFLLGNVLLVGFLFGYGYFYRQLASANTAVINCEASVKCKAEGLQVLRQIRDSNELHLKLFETVFIPFAVFLIAFAVQARVEKSALQRTVDFEKAMSGLMRLELEKDRLITEVGNLIDADGSKHDVMALHRTIVQKSMDMVDSRFDIKEAFPEFSHQL